MDSPPPTPTLRRAADQPTANEANIISDTPPVFQPNQEETEEVAAPDSMENGAFVMEAEQGLPPTTAELLLLVSQTKKRKKRLQHQIPWRTTPS
jgi:hypothetical protein